MKSKLSLALATAFVLVSRVCVLAQGGTFVVNTTNDTSGTNPALSAADSDGNVSLRSAIEAANIQSGQHTIDFNIPGYSGTNPTIFISDIGPLPEITNPVVIDATTQPGLGPNNRVTLIPGSSNAVDYGIFITAGVSSVLGLDIENFVEGIMLTNGGGNIIQANRLAGNTDGVYIGPDASNDPVTASFANVIGGADPGLKNVIVSNSFSGIYAYQSLFNGIEGNLIGVDIGPSNNAVAAGNDWGIILDLSDNNLIGNGTSGGGNLLSGNRTGGLLISGGQKNVVYGNRIGTNPAGTAAMANGSFGIVLASGDLPTGGLRLSSNNKIGGSTSGSTGNLVSGNGAVGILLVSETAAITSNRIQGNLVGVDVTGANPIPNVAVGIYVGGCSLNLIGGTSPGLGNIVSGNFLGITVTDQVITLDTLLSGSYSSSLRVPTLINFVEGNSVGTGISSDENIPNDSYGVLIMGAKGTSIGGTAKGASNLIAANGAGGISIVGGTNSDPATSNVVQGNEILENQGDGVRIGSNATGNEIGGTAKGAGNVIVDNGQPDVGLEVDYGVNITGSGNNAVLTNAILGNGNGPGQIAPANGIHSPSTASVSLTKAVPAGANTKVSWTVTDPANPPGSSYLIQFFSNSVAATAQGGTYLGKASAKLGAGGSATGSVILKGTPDFITATATLMGKKKVFLLTSAFSNVLTNPSP